MANTKILHDAKINL